MEKELADILDLDLEDQTEKPGGEKLPGGDLLSETDKKVEKLSTEIKNQQELIRQQSETIKDLASFKDRLTGPVVETDEEKEKRLREEYIDDPLSTTKKMIESMIGKTNQKIDKTNSVTTAERSMREINRTHIVDWDKDYPKIVDELNKFSDKSKREDPQGCLLRACKNADAAKKRSKNLPTSIEGEGRGGGTNIPKKKGTEADKITKKFENFAARKKSNIFKI